MLHVRRVTVIALLAAVTASSPAAWARKGDKAAHEASPMAAKRAARMEKVGKAAYGKGRYADALIAFDAAFEADPQPKHLYNMARCHEQQGELAKAADYYERYLREAPGAEDREEVETRAEFLTTKLKATMAKLVVTSKPDGAALHIEGKGQALDGKAPWSGWLKPGMYALTALARGHDEHTEKLGLSAGEERSVAVDFLADPKKADPKVATTSEGRPEADEPRPDGKPEPTATRVELEPVASAASPPPPNDEDGTGIGLAPVASFGLAAAGLVSWGVFGLLNVSRKGTVEDAETGRRASGKTRGEMQSEVDSANLFAALANVSLAVAAAAGLTGGALVLLGDGGERATATMRWTW